MRAIALGAFLTAIAAPASAQALGGDVSGIVDLRLGATGGETSWLDGGFGKLRFGGDKGDNDISAELARAALVWRPHFTWSTDAYVELEFDPQQESFVGVGEAYLRFKPMPMGGLRYSVRIGAFYPPVSMEHDGNAWSTTRTLTPSAINTWIGEEVKVGGLEGTATAKAGDGEMSFTGAVFGFNDTAGTLLTFRGWAMHDHQITLNGKFPLPTRDPVWWSMRTTQAHVAEPFREIDGRVGYYARAEWRPAAPFAVNILHYDNGGDGVSYRDLQTSWATQFTNIGLQARIAQGTHILAQAITGETDWVPLLGGPIPRVDDVGFNAAYVMLDQTFGSQGIAARFDAFETRDANQPFSYNSTPEDGWALTAAWRNELSQGLTLMVEGIYVDSDRAARTQIGENPTQKQLSVQSSLRLAF